MSEEQKDLINLNNEANEAVNANENSAPNEANETNDSKNNGGSTEKKKRFKKSDILVFVVCIIAAVAIWAYASDLKRKDDAEKINKGDIPTKEDISEIVGDLNKNEPTKAVEDTQ